jgi:agmatine deiminase
VASVDRSELADVNPYGEFPPALLSTGYTGRILRGDFEPPSTLVVAYEHAWVAQTSQIIAAASGQAQVVVLATTSDLWFANEKWGHLPYVGVLKSELDSPWVRDYGPLAAYEEHSERAVWLDFQYAGDRPHDDQVPELLSIVLRESVEKSPLALDGGAVISNGAGLCAVTEVSLADLYFGERGSKAQDLLASIGCQTTAVIPSIPQETTGHVDVVAQFLDENLAMLGWADRHHNPELARALDQAAQNLEIAAELAGQSLSIVRIPMETNGEIFYSYVNATRLRSRLLVPHFRAVDSATEEAAYAALEGALPEVTLKPIDADAMAELGGAIHCVALGLPSTRLPDKRLAARFAKSRARRFSSGQGAPPPRRRRG